MAQDGTPGRRIRPTRSPGRYRRSGPVLVLGVLLGQLLTGCGSIDPAALDGAQRAVAALPDVAKADFDFQPGGIDSGPYLSGYIAVRSTASPDGVAAVMAEAVDHVAAAGVPGLVGHLQLRIGDELHPRGHAALEDYLDVDIAPPVAAELVAAETRHWLALRERLPGAHMWLEAPPRGPGLMRAVAVSTPGADLPAELTAAFAAFEQVARPPAVGSGLSVVVRDREEPYQRPPIAFSSEDDVPPPEVLAVMRALAELAPAEPEFGNGVTVTWGGAAAEPYLEVAVDIAMDELRHVPGNQINDRVAGSATERLALAHRDALDASGIPYRLRAAAFTNTEPFLEVDRRFGG
jgi:hypothetical protein